MCGSILVSVLAPRSLSLYSRPPFNTEALWGACAGVLLVHPSVDSLHWSQAVTLTGFQNQGASSYNEHLRALFGAASKASIAEGRMDVLIIPNLPSKVVTELSVHLGL